MKLTLDKNDKESPCFIYAEGTASSETWGQIAGTGGSQKGESSVN